MFSLNVYILSVQMVLASKLDRTDWKFYNKRLN